MSRDQAGFTIVELIITLVVIVILVGLSIVVTGNIQANARDNEREQDIASIARALERYYNNGNPYVHAATFTTVGTYPGVYEFTHLNGGNYCNNPSLETVFTPCSDVAVEEALDTPLSAFVPPTKLATEKNIFVFGEQDVTTQAEVDAKVRDGYYVYIPVSSAGPDFECLGLNETVGGAPCRSYSLKYFQETTNRIIEFRGQR